MSRVRRGQYPRRYLPRGGNPLARAVRSMRPGSLCLTCGWGMVVRVRCRGVWLREARRAVMGCGAMYRRVIDQRAGVAGSVVSRGVVSRGVGMSGKIMLTRRGRVKMG